MKFQVCFKTPDVLDQVRIEDHCFFHSERDIDCDDCERVGEELCTQVVQCAEKFIRYGEVIIGFHRYLCGARAATTKVLSNGAIRIEFDTEEGTARVIKVKE